MSQQLPKSSFETWVDHVFNHEVRDPQWYWCGDTEYPDLDSEQVVLYLTELFRNANAILARFSPMQIDQGFWYIISPGASDYLQKVVDVSVSWPLRHNFIESIYSLYAHFWNKHCASVLSHVMKDKSQAALYPLNSSCYMFWDMCYLWSEDNDAYGGEQDKAILEVLRNSLALENIACKESALHGLGHVPVRFRNDAVTIIECALENKAIPEELMNYVHRSMTGNIQ